MASPLRPILATLAACALAAPAAAEVRLPAFFSDGMVLQADMPVRLWGWADPGEDIVVRAAGGEAAAKADDAGRWSLELPPMPASAAGIEVVVEGASGAATLRDVLVGEVWIASGQSNMQWTINQTDHRDEAVDDPADPLLRFFTVERRIEINELDDTTGAWLSSSPEVVREFSAAAYFFAQSLRRELDVPVGIVAAAHGGTVVDAWIPLSAVESRPELAALRESLAAIEEEHPDHRERFADYQRMNEDNRDARRRAMREFRDARQAALDAGEPFDQRPPDVPDFVRAPGWRNLPGALYGGMIHPLVGLQHRGIIWYQGESNSGFNRDLYADMLVAMVEEWRARWGGDTWFLQVQLPNFQKPQAEPVEDSGWAFIRDAQRLAADRLPMSGFITTIDVGDADDLHPRNKRPIGERLAAVALARAYGLPEAGGLPPRPMHLEFGESEIRVRVQNAEGLRLFDGVDAIRGFAAAGPDRAFHRVEARLDGDSIVLSGPAVGEAIAVRYAWAQNPPAEIKNKSGMPLSTFRTDDWLD